MGERELREKYGGKLPKAINRAIRAEVPGGNEALDVLTHLAASAKQSHWHDKQGRPTLEATAYYKHQRDVVGKMEAQVRRTWGLPPAEVDRGMPPRARPKAPHRRAPAARRDKPRAAGAAKAKPAGRRR
jgi:hypothetical protein